MGEENMNLKDVYTFNPSKSYFVAMSLLEKDLPPGFFSFDTCLGRANLKLGEFLSGKLDKMFPFGTFRMLSKSRDGRVFVSAMYPDNPDLLKKRFHEFMESGQEDIFEEMPHE